jgi:CHAT domain-containing protein
LKRICVIILVSIGYQNFAGVQNSDIYDNFLQFARLYNSGDLVSAEKSMLTVLESKEAISEAYLVAAYNNLGATYTVLGKYKDALEYYNLAEAQITHKKQLRQSLADIYINKALIYISQKSYSMAIEYLEKGIRIYLDISQPDKNLLQSLSTAYLNIGEVYYELKDYQISLEYLEKSALLKSRYNLPKIAFTYLNIAKTYVKTGESMKAQEYYLKSIADFSREFGENYFRLTELLFDYGLFLESEEKFADAHGIYNKALSICLNNYDEKNTFVSLAYKHLGDYYIKRNNYDSSLVYYQKALIAIVENFDNPDIYSNPSVKFSLFDIRLLDILKSKSRVLNLRSQKLKDNKAKINDMKKSMETIELAIQLINKIRNDYMNEESRIYLAENEKETYVTGVNISKNLYRLTGDRVFIQNMYNITKQAKTAVLRNGIADNELFYSVRIPDTLQQKHKNLLLEIGAYSNLVEEEKQKPDPDNKKIDYWEDTLFDMKRENEKLEDNINKQFPQYKNLLQKTEPISIDEIKHNLKKGETLLEYFMSNQYKDGRRKLYIFLITEDNLNYLETDLDSLFKKNVERIRQGTLQIQGTNNPLDNFKKYTSALFYMYEKLIKPAENLFRGNKLIIVPDEEIAFLPFDAFLRSCPDSTQINYEQLQYLIYNYSISYAYSSSLIFNRKMSIIQNEKVYAFSPGYVDDSTYSGNTIDYLAGATNEIGSISRMFPANLYLGDQATEANFKAVIQYPAIFHLAMHSLPDPYNSKYSCLLFDTRKDTLEDGKLYNYEISLNRIRSPMVVLSACNTGTGTLSRGEGIMSLARGFILAGASSVVLTFWDVNDEASVEIITRFYYHLSKGRGKNEAMHLSKLEYLKCHPPIYTNPYYWAGYEVLGDNSPIVLPFRISLLLIGSILFLVAGILIFYFRCRIIFSARSR